MSGLLILAIGLLGAAAPGRDLGPMGPDAAVQPRHRFDWSSWWTPPDYWRRRIDEKRRAIASSGGHYDMVFVGDSITQNWEGWTDPPSRDFIAGLVASGRLSRVDAHLDPTKAWRELEKSHAVLNLGISGDATAHILWRLTMEGELDGYTARSFTVMAGTNDTGPAEEAAAGVRAIVGEILRRHPESTVILHPVFPRGERPDSEQRIRVDAINRIIRAAADGKRVVWCDFNARLLEPDGTLSRRMMPDFLHPQEAGYAIWAEALRPFLSAPQ